MASKQQKAERAEAAARLAADDLKDVNKGDMTYKVTEKTTTTEPERSGTLTSSDDEARTAVRGDEATEKTTVPVDVKDTKAGHVATSLGASDQMIGQTFNDVGGMEVKAVKWKM